MVILKSKKAVQMVFAIMAAFLIFSCTNHQVEIEKQGYPFTVETFVSRAAAGDMATVRHFADSGMNVNSQDKFFNTPLIEASRNGHIEIVKFLIDRGADPTIKTDSGHTAYWAAEIGGHSEIVKYFRSKGIYK